MPFALLAMQRRFDCLTITDYADMVTRNPASALGWSEVGSLGPGKHADVLLLRRPRHSTASPYGNLIDATQRDVRLVLLDGRPLAGDPDALRAVGARGIQIMRSTRGRFTKAIVAATSLAAADARIARVLHARPPLFTVDDRRFLDVLAGRTRPKPNFVDAGRDPFAEFATRWYAP